MKEQVRKVQIEQCGKAIKDVIIKGFADEYGLDISTINSEELNKQCEMFGNMLKEAWRKEKGTQLMGRLKDEVKKSNDILF